MKSPATASTSSTPSTNLSDAELRAALSQAIQRVGVRRVSEAITLTPESCLRLATGERVRRGTMALLAANAATLASLGAP